MKNKFKRNRNTRPLSKLFLVLPEGSLSEGEYFEQIRAVFTKESGKTCCLHVPSPVKSKNNPISLKNRMDGIIREKRYEANYEAWLIFDRDQWVRHEIDAVEKWCKKDTLHHHYALSNPKFEYWLLLHLENVSGCITSDEATRRLKVHYSDFVKSIPRGFVTMERVRFACQQARAKFTSCPNVRDNNGSTVYQLIESLAQEAGIDLS